MENMNPDPVPAAVANPKLNLSFKEVWQTFQSLIPSFARIYWETLKRYLLWVALPLLVIVGSWFLSENERSITGALGIIAIVAIVIAILASIYFMIWLQVAMVLAVKQRAEAPDIKQLFVSARPLIRPYFWTSFLGGILTMLWTLLLIIPGIIFGIYYSLAPYVMVDENLSGYAAVKRSKELVKGLWWPVFGYFVIIILATIAFYVIGYYADLALGFDPKDSGIVSNLITIVYMPLAITFEYLIYEKVKQAKS